MEELYYPTDDVEPDQIVVDKIDDEGAVLPLEEVEGHDEDESQEGGDEQHDDLELVVGDDRLKDEQLSRQVAHLDHCQDSRLNPQAVQKESMGATEQQRVH